MAFLAWQEAEHLASEAERRLFAELCDAAAGTLPIQDEAKETRALRENASRRMKEMLDEMRVVADSLKYSAARRGGMSDTRHAIQGSEP